MRHSTERILTTHAGSLSRPVQLIELSRTRGAEDGKDNAAYTQCLAASVADVVRKQRELGIDIPDDGEFGKPVAGSYDYGAWWNYAFARLSGFSPAAAAAAPALSKHKKSGVADLALASFANRRDWQKFGEFYQDPESSGSLMGSAARRPVDARALSRFPQFTVLRLANELNVLGFDPLRREIAQSNPIAHGDFGFRGPANCATAIGDLGL